MVQASYSHLNRREGKYELGPVKSFTPSYPPSGFGASPSIFRVRICVMPRGRTVQLRSLPVRKADFIEPMDCAPVPKLIDGPGWVYEIKLDGYRAVAVKFCDSIDLFSVATNHSTHSIPLSLKLCAICRRARLSMVKLWPWMKLASQISICFHSFAAELRVSATSFLISSFARTVILLDCL
jgi:hypothetical protein